MFEASVTSVSDFIGSYSRNLTVIHRSVMTTLYHWDKYYLALEEKSMKYLPDPRVIPQPGILSNFIDSLHPI